MGLKLFSYFSKGEVLVKVKAEENDQFFSKIPKKNYLIPFLSDMVWLEMCSVIQISKYLSAECLPLNA